MPFKDTYLQDFLFFPSPLLLAIAVPALPWRPCSKKSPFQNQTLVSGDTQRYIITYSLDPNFKQYSMVDINQYLRQIIGVSKYSLDQINGVNEYTVGGIVKY